MIIRSFAHLLTIVCAILLNGCATAPNNQEKLPIEIYGEIHGTREIPDQFARIVTDKLRKSSPVSVGLEVSAGDIRSACRALQRNSSMSTSNDWINGIQDGRHSAAMAKLTCDLSRVRGVRLFPLVTDDSTSQRDKMIADSVTANARPDQAMLILVGNLHARNTGSSAAGLLRTAGLPVVTYVFDARKPSQAWIMTNSAAKGPVDIGARFCSTNQELTMAGVILKDTPGARWDKCISLDQLTASFPIERR
jgi:hypothetical protein